MEIGELGPRGDRVVGHAGEEHSLALVSATIRHHPMEEQLASEIHRNHNNATRSRVPLVVRI